MDTDQKEHDRRRPTSQPAVYQPTVSTAASNNKAARWSEVERLLIGGKSVHEVQRGYTLRVEERCVYISRRKRVHWLAGCLAVITREKAKRVI